ncbi:MAG: hypothetical protein AAGG68_13020 [Bacteroidota bacterium]
MQLIKNIVLITLIFSSFQLFGQESEQLIIPLSDSGKRGKLEVGLHRGNISVKGTNRKDILIRYASKEKKVSRIEDAGNGLKRLNGNSVDLQVTERKNEVEIGVGHNTTVNLTIEIPSNFDLDVYTHHSDDILLENINGEIEVQSHHGGLVAKSISGSLVANSWHGDLIVTFNKVTPNIPLAFSTYHGNVDITIPSGTKANLKLKSEQGEILTGFDVNLKAQAPTVKNTGQGGTYKVNIDNWVMGTINGGGSEILAKNHDGDIYIRKGN